jgi:hypothetical protein
MEVTLELLICNVSILCVDAIDWLFYVHERNYTPVNCLLAGSVIMDSRKFTALTSVWYVCENHELFSKVAPFNACWNAFQKVTQPEKNG